MWNLLAATTCPGEARGLLLTAAARSNFSIRFSRSACFLNASSFGDVRHRIAKSMRLSASAVAARCRLSRRELVRWSRTWRISSDQWKSRENESLRVREKSRFTFIERRQKPIDEPWVRLVKR